MRISPPHEVVNLPEFMVELCYRLDFPLVKAAYMGPGPLGFARQTEKAYGAYRQFLREQGTYTSQQIEESLQMGNLSCL